ncbi:MAG: hypothetical protein P8Y45_17240 [Exilibacterium sp.]
MNIENDEDNLAQLERQWDYEAGNEFGTLKTGLTYVESTKTAVKRNGTNLSSSQTLPNGLTFTEMTVAEKLALMNPSMPIEPYAQDAGAGFPTNWASFSRSTIENFFMPNRANRGSSKDDPIVESSNKGNDLQRWRAGVGYLDTVIGYARPTACPAYFHPCG